MNHAPWTNEQAEQWALDFVGGSDKCRESFLSGLAKAAEMIEASPTVWGRNDGEWGQGNQVLESDTHTAKLVGVRPIGEEEK